MVTVNVVNNRSSSSSRSSSNKSRSTGGVRVTVVDKPKTSREKTVATLKVEQEVKKLAESKGGLTRREFQRELKKRGVNIRELRRATAEGRARYRSGDDVFEETRPVVTTTNEQRAQQKVEVPIEIKQQEARGTYIGREQFIRRSEPSGQATGIIEQASPEQSKTIREAQLAGNLFDVPREQIKDKSTVGFGFGKNKPRIPTERLDTDTSTTLFFSAVSEATGKTAGQFFSNERKTFQYVEPRFGTVYTNPLTGVQETNIIRTGTRRSTRKTVERLGRTASRITTFYPEMAGGTFESGARGSIQGKGFFRSVGKFAVDRPVATLGVFAGGLSQLFPVAVRGTQRFADELIMDFKTPKDLRGMGGGRLGKKGSVQMTKSQYADEVVEVMYKGKIVRVLRSDVRAQLARATTKAQKIQAADVVFAKLKNPNDPVARKKAFQLLEDMYGKKFVQEYKVLKSTVFVVEAPKQTTTKVQSNVLGLKPQTKEIMTTFQKSNVLSITAPVIGSLPRTKSESQQRQRNFMALSPNQGVLSNTTNTTTSQSQESSTTQKQTTRFFSSQTIGIQQNILQTNGQTGRIPTERTPRRPVTTLRPIPTKTPVPSMTKKVTAKKKLQGFIPEVKDKGKWIKASKKVHTREEALRIASKIADNSTAVSIRVKTTKKKPVKPKSKQPFKSTKFRNYRLSKGKRVPLPKNNFIEKKTYRIDTLGEKKKLSALAIIGKRTKSRRRK